MCYNALLIHARKLAMFIPMLAQMEVDCRANLSVMTQRVNKLFSAKDPKQKEFRDQIIHWLKFLYSCEEYVADWDIDYISWLEIDDEVKKAYPDAEFEKHECIQMGCFAMRRQQFLNLYNEAKVKNHWT